MSCAGLAAAQAIGDYKTRAYALTVFLPIAPNPSDYLRSAIASHIIKICHEWKWL